MSLLLCQPRRKGVYGTRSEVSKKTSPFKNASQYDMLVMEQLAPALSATAEDAEDYQRDLEEYGTLTLEQVKRNFGLE